MTTYPRLSHRLRFRLATTLARLAVFVLPYGFVRRFSEETNELLEPKFCLRWLDDNDTSFGETWTQDGTQRIA